MRHNKDNKRFSRNSGHLKALFSNLSKDLITHERLTTTTAKAKELRRYVERMITLGKAGDLASRRRAMAFMRSKGAVTKLFDDVALRYKSRPGGYTRIIKLGVRNGDRAPISIIELVEGEVVKKAEPTTPKPKAKKAEKVEAAVETKPAETKEAEKTEKPEQDEKAETTEKE
ncbi:MAG: 50S ribosomal protein L17 [Deltaproteobacteria bacterium]|nr:50S ribosomal protein L17 [Deltaproteobacteria bacterium]